MPETVLKIRLFGDPVLRRKAKPVKQITSLHRDILSKMAQIMYAGSGIGLAAPQVGISEEMIVADIGNGGLYKLINPKIIKKQRPCIMEEGCLSVPGVCIKVRRAKKIVVKAEDENALPITIEAEGLLARVFQHEIDHLKGKLIIDYASLIERLRMRNKLEEFKKKARDEELSGSEARSCKLKL